MSLIGFSNLPLGVYNFLSNDRMSMIAQGEIKGKEPAPQPQDPCQESPVLQAILGGPQKLSVATPSEKIPSPDEEFCSLLEERSIGPLYIHNLQKQRVWSNSPEEAIEHLKRRRIALVSKSEFRIGLMIKMRGHIEEKIFPLSKNGKNRFLAKDILRHKVRQTLKSIVAEERNRARASIDKVKMDRDVKMIRDIFQIHKKHEHDFSGAKRYSRRGPISFNDTYFAVEDTATKASKVYKRYHGRIENFPSASFAKIGYLNEGGIKEVFELEDVDGIQNMVCAVHKDRSNPIPANVLAFIKEFGNEDGPHLLVPKYVKWMSIKSGIEKEGLLTLKMESDCLKFINNQFFLYAKRLNVAGQILLGLKQMHNKDWVHRDLKPENILTYRETVKIGDFDFAKKVTESTVLDISGTPGYIAPELLTTQVKGVDAAKKTDMYSLGVTLYEIIYGKSYVKSAVLPPAFTYADEMIGKMLSENPADRPDINSIDITRFFSY